MLWWGICEMFQDGKNVHAPLEHVEILRCSPRMQKNFSWLPYFEVISYRHASWSTGITKGQFETLKQIQKCAMYIIAPHLQYNEAITKFILPTIIHRLDILVIFSVMFSEIL